MNCYRIQDLYFRKAEPISIEPSQATEDQGSISVTTTAAHYGKGKGDILLTKNKANGNEQWFASFGGTSYDKAGSVYLSPDDKGYLLIGSTSSFGKGNYDIWLIKTDAKGKELWSKTYGSHLMSMAMPLT